MISKALKIAAAGLALMALAGQAGASERVTVERNGMVRVGLAGSAGSVIVANPNIADVNVVDSHTVYIIGRGYGSSAVTILDHAGKAIFEGQVMVTAGQHNAVMMYKGSTPSVMDCSNVCQPAAAATGEDGDSNVLTAIFKAANAAKAGPGSTAPATPAPMTPAVANAAAALEQ